MDQISDKKIFNKNTLYKAFFGLIVFFLTFGWLMVFFAATRLFFSASVVISMILAAIASFFFVPKIFFEEKKSHLPIFAGIIALSFIISLATCFFATPTVFGGRDQGAIATAAINLSKNHQLEFSTPVSQDLFKKYGPGKALNYPGFDYTRYGQLLSRFPVGYTAYLAGAYNLLGLKGIQYANLIPLFLFLVLFWLTLREFFDGKISFLGFLLAATFFPFLWFAKYALTEIYTLFLVWAGIYLLIISLRNSSSRRLDIGCLSVSLAALGLSALVRIEGLVFFLLAAIYIFALQRKKIIEFPKIFKKYLSISILSVSILYLYLNFPALFDSTKNFVKAFLPNSVKDSAPSANLYSELARIFYNYNILLYLILGLIGILWLAKNFRKNWPKPELIPIFLTFPAFIYFVSPMITLDDPWLLRRFTFAVFPVLIFYSVYALERLFHHRFFLYLVFVVILAANLIVSSRFFTTSENKNLLPQIEKISQKFGPEDLILVDRTATGSGFSLMSEPMSALFGKNAVYFFNAEDLRFLDRARYKNIYLAVPGEESPSSWYANIEKQSAGFSVITNNFLEPSEKKWGLSVNTEFKGVIVFWKTK